MPMLRVAMMLLAALVLATPCPGDAAGSAGGAFCGTRGIRPKAYDHVVWIWMENHSYDDIIGSLRAPYINQLAQDCGLATNFHSTTHVSLPNYIAATSGLTVAQVQPFIFDCNPSATCSTSAPSIFGQAPSWKAYEESMSMNCEQAGVAPYAVRHNPPAYYSTLGTCGLFDVAYTELQQDLDNDTLPAFVFITPNSVHDMHDPVFDPISINNGDAWLHDELPKILNSATYAAGRTVVFVTFDEGEPVGSIPPGFFGEDCSKNRKDESCHVATIVVSPSTRGGTKSRRYFTHYSLLKTAEQLLKLKPYLGQARRAPSMRKAFDL